MPLPPRQHRLDRDDAGQANANMLEPPWWQPRREWRPGMHFADGPTERVIDRSPLPLPVAVGMYGSTGAQLRRGPVCRIEIDSGISS
jgi:hypothetical protein